MLSLLFLFKIQKNIISVDEVVDRSICIIRNNQLWHALDTDANHLPDQENRSHFLHQESRESQESLPRQPQATKLSLFTAVTCLESPSLVTPKCWPTENGHFCPLQDGPTMDNAQRL
jgi:hypothetical protein